MTKQSSLVLFCTILISSTPILGAEKPTTLQRVAQGMSVITTLASIGSLLYLSQHPGLSHSYSLISHLLLGTGLAGIYFSDAFGWKTKIEAIELPPIKADSTYIPISKHTFIKQDYSLYTVSQEKSVTTHVDNEVWVDRFEVLCPIT